MKLVMLGPPGAGKGTQAANVSRQMGIAHVATGDLFRQAQNNGTELGLVAKSYMEKGMLVPDEVTIKMVKERIEAPDCARGFVVDGFPRNTAQALALDGLLDSLAQGLDKALYLRVSTEELVGRLTGRWICRSCQSPYHEVNAAPNVAGVCDKCGGSLYQRADDQEDTIRQRIKVYADETAPLVDYYVAKEMLVEIDADESIEGVERQLGEALS